MVLYVYVCVTYFSISLILNSFYNILLSDKKGIFIKRLILKSVREPISVSSLSTLFWNKAALAVINEEHDFPSDGLKRAATWRSMSNRG